MAVRDSNLVVLQPLYPALSWMRAASHQAFELDLQHGRQKTYKGYFVRSCIA
jgi:hypothetical protein